MRPRAEGPGLGSPKRSYRPNFKFRPEGPEKDLTPDPTPKNGKNQPHAWFFSKKFKKKPKKHRPKAGTGVGLPICPELPPKPASPCTAQWFYTTGAPGRLAPHSGATPAFPPTLFRSRRDLLYPNNRATNEVNSPMPHRGRLGPKAREATA